MKPENLTEEDNQTYAFDLEPQALNRKDRDDFVSEAGSTPVFCGPFLTRAQIYLKINQNNFGMDKKAVSVLKDSWIKVGAGKGNNHFGPSAEKEQIIHLLEGHNDLANFSILSFHVLGTGASYIRGMGLTGTPSQMLSLPSLSLAFCPS